MGKEITSQIFSILIENSKNLSELIDTIDIDKIGELDEKFDESYEEDAFLFESMALLYTHLSITLVNKRPDIWKETNVSLIFQITNYLDNIFLNRNLKINYIDLFLSRVIQFDEGGELKILLTNISKHNFLQVAENHYMAVLKQNEELLDNTKLFYFWNQEPLSIKKPSKYTLSESNQFCYKGFMERYYVVSRNMMNELINLTNNV